LTPQVLRLCEAHGLFSAASALYNRLADYRRPLLDMLAAVAGLVPPPSPHAAHQGQQEQGQAPGPGLAAPAGPGNELSAAAAALRRDAGFKLLVYLRCCFTRQRFPPGTGPLPALIPGAGRDGAEGAAAPSSQSLQPPAPHSSQSVLHAHCRASTAVPLQLLSAPA
jgi:hypothetical protein